MEKFFYLVSNSLIINLLVFVIFWKQPGFKKIQTLLLILINLSVKLIVLNGELGQIEDTRWIEILFSVISMGIYCFCIPTDLFRIVFYYLLILDYVIVVRGIASYVAVSFFSQGAQSWYSTSIGLVLYFMAFPLMIFYAKRAFSLLNAPTAKPFWRIICLIPAANTVLILLYTNAFDTDNIDEFFLASRILLLINTLTVCALLLYILENIVHSTMLAEQVKYGEQILMLQRGQYTDLQRRIDEMRSMRHDLRQHVHVLQCFLADGKTEELQKYIEKYTVSLKADNTKRYCRNTALDTLLHYYAEKFEEAGIKYEIEVRLPEKMEVPDPDLCVTFGNLLENALEACTDQKQPYVRVAAQVSGREMISLIVDNTAEKPPLTKEGKFLSSKHDGFGIGTQSIRLMAARYHGTARFEWKDGMFYASVLLNPCQM